MQRRLAKLERRRALRADQLTASSPIEQVKLNARKLPPILIARAGADSPALNATIDRFVAEALSRDVPVELHNVKGAPHAFDVQSPTAEVRELIQRLDFTLD